MTLHDTRFPGESSEYRRARDELLQAELELRRQIEGVAAQRRALPLGGEVPSDYPFDEWDAAVGKVRQVRLSELFAPGKDSLVVYNFMFKPGDTGRPLDVPCPLCTSIIDGLDGAVPHITEGSISLSSRKRRSSRFSPTREPGAGVMRACSRLRGQPSTPTTAWSPATTTSTRW